MHTTRKVEQELHNKEASRGTTTCHFVEIVCRNYERMLVLVDTLRRWMRVLDLHACSFSPRSLSLAQVRQFTSVVVAMFVAKCISACCVVCPQEM